MYYSLSRRERSKKIGFFQTPQKGSVDVKKLPIELKRRKKQ